MYKIRQVSHCMVNIFTVLLITIPLMLLLYWSFVYIKASELLSWINVFHQFREATWTPEGVVYFSQTTWSLPTVAMAFFAELVGLMPFLISLFLLKSIFNDYHQGKVFSISNATRYKHLGWISLVNALIIHPISNSLLVLSVTLANSPGHRYFTLEFGLPNLEAIFLGVLLVIISWVMVESSKIYDEQKLTI